MCATRLRGLVEVPTQPSPRSPADGCCCWRITGGGWHPTGASAAARHGPRSHAPAWKRTKPRSADAPASAAMCQRRGPTRGRGCRPCPACRPTRIPPGAPGRAPHGSSQWCLPAARTATMRFAGVWGCHHPARGPGERAPLGGGGAQRPQPRAWGSPTAAPEPRRWDARSATATRRFANNIIDPPGAGAGCPTVAPSECDPQCQLRH